MAFFIRFWRCTVRLDTFLRAFMRDYRLRRTLLELSIGLLLIHVTPVAAQTVSPDGWSSRTVQQGVQVLTPPGLAMGSVFTITVFDPVGIGAATQDAWLASRADADVAAERNARVEGRSAVSQSGTAIRSSSRVLITPSGARLLGVYFSIDAGSGQARLVRVLTSSTALLREHQVVTSDIVRQFSDAAASTIAATAQTVPSAITAPSVLTLPAARPPASPAASAVGTEEASRISSDMVVRTPAPRRSAIRAGGAFVPGMYVGRQIYTDTREVISEMTLWLYANGEYRQQWKGSTKDPREGEFAYDPSTGRIDLEWGSLMTIVNSRIDPNVDFAVMGTNLAGVPSLLAENDRGFHTMLTVLVRAGANDRPAPSVMKTAAAAAEVEAARYKHVVEPGRGVQDAQIAAIYMHSEMRQTMGLSFQLGVTSTLSLYLLLNDGTVHDGVPVAPDEMDVATSRRRDPARWGRWRREGNTVVVAWDQQPSTWGPLQGEPMLKFRPDEELRGRFSGGESTAAGDVSSFSLYGVTFGAGRTFETDSRGGSGTGSFTQTTSGTSVQTTRDDHGSVTTASTPGAIVSAGRRGSDAARVGTYRVSGWNLEARYGDGRVERHPMFFLDADRDAIYWRGKVVTLTKTAP